MVSIVAPILFLAPTCDSKFDVHYFLENYHYFVMTPQEFWHYIVSYVKDMTHMSFVNISVFKIGVSSFTN